MFLEACSYCPMHAQSEEQLSTEIVTCTSQPQNYYQQIKKIYERKKKNPEVLEEILVHINQLNFKEFI